MHGKRWQIIAAFGEKKGAYAIFPSEKKIVKQIICVRRSSNTTEGLSLKKKKRTLLECLSNDSLGIEFDF